MSGFAKRALIVGGALPAGCTLDSLIVGACAADREDPCQGCNEHRAVCGGRERGDARGARAFESSTTLAALLRLRGGAAFLLLLCLAVPVMAAPPAITGPAQVIDGDTIRVQGERVRLFGVDAPEKEQTCRRASGSTYHCGWRSAIELERMIGDLPVRCLRQGQLDRYGRAVARCYVASGRGPALDLGGALVERGLALAARRYSLEYAGAEATARESRSGMWEGTFVRPEEWRKGVRK